MKRTKIENRSIKITKNELTQEQIEEIRETFDILDINKINQINFTDLKIAMLALGLTPSDDEFERIIKQIGNEQIIRENFNNNRSKQCVSFQEFYEIVSFRLSNLEHRNQNRNKIFSLIAKFENDKFIIDNDSIKNLLTRFNENMKDEEIKEILEAADFDKNGKITEEDFFKILKNTNF